MTNNKTANRLRYEKSPYLLQHAYNPVDWYAWGDEAFAKAQKEDKPIFLSIGYSTCHWCHVMERESFADQEVADVLNRIFVCIKVDREERPDVDNFYMNVCQAMTGSGGWPLTIFMLPDKRPFFAGTYFPKQTKYGRMGLLELARRIEELWQTRRADLMQTAQLLMDDLHATSSVAPGELPGEEVLHKAFQQLAERFDSEYGGFHPAPKFPTPHNLTFLLRYWKRTGNGKALFMVEKTLTAMRNGGIFDQVGFGFHRYSTDPHWLLPHFEKMLYDQALLAIAYLETYQATHNELYADAAHEIFTYVLRDMTSPEGGFYSAEDADSEGKEGKFYVWSAEEIERVLGKKDAALFCKVYNISAEGNFVEETTHLKTGLNIPYRTKTLTEFAAENKKNPAELTQALEIMRQKLFAARKKRIHPYKDDKILTDWNGLMIAALSMGGRILQVSRYTEAASMAANFILQKLKHNNRLLKRYRHGEAALPAHLDDYAFFCWGLLELYESTFIPAYLSEALALNQIMLEHFWDRENGAFFFTAEDVKDAPVRQRELYDGALPSGNSVAAMNNLRLARLTGNEELTKIAQKIAQAFAAEIKKIPQAYTMILSALDFILGPTIELVIAGKPQAADTQAMLKKIHTSFIPNKVVLLHPGGKEGRAIESIAPFTREQKALNNKATAYICKNFACQAPITDANSLLKALTEI
ncbi:MAG: thioredoxin domain-containing protein [Firmicutes bacterium]|nr:thioredoxin domain-containing protein [Bacillota bacterium]